MNNHLLSQFFNVDEEQLLAAAESLASTGPQIWPASNPVYVKTEDSGDDASSNASWGFPATPMDYDDAPATINCIPGGLAQISLPGSSRSPSPDMTLTLPGGFNFAAAAQQQQQKPVSAIPAHLRPREMALSPSSLVSPPVVPTPLQQQQQSPQQKSNGRKLNSPSSASSPAPSPAPELNSAGQPHPYSISASNTTALFTRASSVSSNASGPTKKGRAPPSGPISTKDFVPPDVSGLSKREARLVKNRAAAFLSRQRKREEFEGLEARVEVLEADNARLYKELEAYRSGSSSAAAPALAPSGATPAALQAELVGLRRQLGARDQELAKLHARMQAINADANAERERLAEKDDEIAQLKRQLAARGGVAAAPIAVAAASKKDDDSDSDSEDAQSTTDGMVVSGKKDLKSAGSMAFMVLLFSLSSLLTSAESSGSAKPPVASERVRRPGMHHRDSSRTYLDLPSQAFSSGLPYDSFLSTSDSSMMLSPSFGFDEDNLLGGSSAFAGLSTASPTQPPRQQKAQDNHVADSLASAISSVKSVSPEEFEFDFTVPSTSSSSLDSFAFPARPQQQKAGRKIRVCVKSALPLNLNLDALSKAASTSSAATAGSSQKTQENELFTSSFGYRVPETDDLLGEAGFWNGAASTFGGSSSPSSVLSPTMSTASSESRKRKRVVVEINPRGGSRRRLSEDTDDEMDTWDVKFSEDDDLVVGASDEDVQMRL